MTTVGRALAYTKTLAPGSHSVTVSAVNAVGTGAPSAPRTFVVTDSLVVVIDSTTVGAGTATVTWSPPATGTVIGYVVGRNGVDTSGSGAYSTEVASTVRTFQMTRLVAGDTYVLSVAAVTASGTGAASTASVTIPAAVSTGADWSDEFTALDIVTATKSSAFWYAAPDGDHLAGYSDNAGVGWNANPNQDFGGSVGVMNPYQIGPIAGATDGVGLTITCQPYTDAQRSAVASYHGSAPGDFWGGMLTSQAAYTYGYFEFRVRWPNPHAGMWPALWFYAKGGGRNQGSWAEIDLLEIFGSESGSPWVSTVHAVGDDNATAGNWNSDTTGWHTYGLDWQSDRVDFYKDHVKVGGASAADSAFFQNTDMQVRINYTMTGPNGDAGWATQPNSASYTPLLMYVDYLRHWTTRPF